MSIPPWRGGTTNFPQSFIFEDEDEEDRIVSRTSRQTREDTRRRVDRMAGVNGQPDPARLLNIQRSPEFDFSYASGGGRRRVPSSGVTIISGPQVASNTRSTRATRQRKPSTTVGGNEPTYITAAFRSSCWNEVYIFMKKEYLLLNYAPWSTNDRVVNPPLLISDGYPSLRGTVFGEYGIDCAFGTHYRNQAFIFCGNLCAHIDFAPHSFSDKILRGPITIGAMFPFLKRTVFESGVDAAFEATARDEAYIFKGDNSALINYGSSGGRLICSRPIVHGFPCLTNTIFESGIEAAFASHRANEAYIFKGIYYALLDFESGYLTGGGVKQTLLFWPSLRSVLPR